VHAGATPRNQAAESPALEKSLKKETWQASAILAWGYRRSGAISRSKWMRLGARVGFNSMEELGPHFEGVDFPVELALPYKVGDFLKIAGRMPEVRDFILTKGVEVLSVHATQGNLFEDRYRRWAGPAMALADQLGASSVTFHPNQAKSQRTDMQILAKQHLRDLQRNAKALAALETFGGRHRVFHPEEIMRAGLPMVLDVAHLHEDDLILRLIRDYHKHIPTVHLSARGEGEHHLPIDGFCLKAVRMLQELGWNGGVVLEYLPWHHYRVRADLDLLRRFLGGEAAIEVPPPDDGRKHDQAQWGFD
jgi:hypothetical protein